MKILKKWRNNAHSLYVLEGVEKIYLLVYGLLYDSSKDSYKLSHRPLELKSTSRHNSQW